MELLRIVLVGFLLVFMATLGGCTSLTRGQPPAIDVRVWAGDFTKSAIVRKEGKVQISCDEPLFSDYLAMTFDDFEKLIGTYNEACEKWKPK